MESYDSIYKKMFSSPDMVKSLLRLFGPPGFVEKIDLDSLTPLNGEFQAESGEERRSDLIWRVNAGDKTCYILILLEFQSRNDNWMALGVLAYSALLLQSLVKSGAIKTGELLPPLLPFVIYNGTAPWQAACSMAELSAKPGVEIEDFQPRQKYHLIDVGRIAANALKWDNLSALLFRLERYKDVEDVIKALDSLQPIMPDDGFLERAFISLLKSHVFSKAGSGINITGCETLEEVRDMLVDGAPNWEQIYIDKGIAIGEAKGFQLGEAKGFQLGEAQGIKAGKTAGELSALVSVVRDALAAKFGEPSEAISERIMRITDTAFLKQLALDILMAKSSEEFYTKLDKR